MFQEGRQAGKSWQRKYAIALRVGEWVKEVQIWDDYYRARYERIAWRVGSLLNRPPKDDWLKRVWTEANGNTLPHYYVKHWLTGSWESTDEYEHLDSGRYSAADWGTGKDSTVHTRGIRMGDVKTTIFHEHEYTTGSSERQHYYLCNFCKQRFTFAQVFSATLGGLLSAIKLPVYCPICGTKREDPNEALIEEVYRQLTGVEITSDQGLKLISFIRSIVRS